MLTTLGLYFDELVCGGTAGTNGNSGSSFA